MALDSSATTIQYVFLLIDAAEFISTSPHGLSPDSNCELAAIHAQRVTVRIDSGGNL
jgi:hypothetical protein